MGKLWFLANLVCFHYLEMLEAISGEDSGGRPGDQGRITLSP